MRRFVVFIFFASLIPFSPTKADEGDCYCIFDDDTYDQYESSRTDNFTSPEECRSPCSEMAEAQEKTLSSTILETEDGADFSATEEGVQSPDEAGLEPSESGLVAGLEAAEDRRAEIAARAEAFAAANQCQCYCGVEGVGAQVLDGTYKQDAECKTACTAAGKEFVTCASTGSETPLANPLCWGQDECATKLGTWDEDFQPTECEPSRRYCYPAATEVDLNVDIGPIDKISDIGSYINAIYTYGLGAAAIVAVVLIMIGGAQYIIGSGIGSVEAGRKRITNAVTGLVILLGAYLLLATVNPYLVNWQTLRVPKLKPTLFVNNNCEAYEALGYIVDPVEVSSVDAGTYCGDAGIVSSSPDGVSMSSDCIYDSCRHTAIADDFCVSSEDEYVCLSCAIAGADAADRGLEITESFCQSLTPPLSSLKSTRKDQCRMMREADVTIASSVLESTDVCGLITIDCATVTSCGLYESLKITQGDNTNISISSENWYEQLVDTCGNNPCADKVTDGPCVAVNAEGTAYANPYGNQNRTAAANRGEKLSSELIVGSSFFSSGRYQYGLGGDDYIVCLPNRLTE